MKKSHVTRIFIGLLVVLGIAGMISERLATAQTDAIRQGFQTPPNAAKPRVWWHWMNGNITKDGIQKDLEWMQRVGIGGFQNFDASLFTPQVVDKRLIYMTPEWKEAFKFTTELADKLGLEMAIAGSPGWSESGGPWVPAKDGMKKYVWSETRIKGGQQFAGKLLQPPDVTGAFQNVPFRDPLGVAQGGHSSHSFYEDTVVIAYRAPASDIGLRELNPKITASGGQFDLHSLTDGDLAKTSLLPPTAIGQNAWIQFEFDQPQTFRALTIVAGEPAAAFSPVESNRTLEASDDGVNFRAVLQIPITQVPQNTVTFAPATAKYFRLSVKTMPPQPNMIAAMMGLPMGDMKPKGTNVAEIVLHATTRVNRLEEKAGFVPSAEIAQFVTPNSTDAIPTNDVIDLTSKMKSDGTLEWAAPTGNWVVLRMGYSLLGIQNHPASPEATGLEVDKLDAQAVKDYFENYLDQYKNATSGLMGKRGLQYVITDSYEAGGANWTKNLIAEFAKRRGYDLKSWLPVLTGQIVKSTEASEQFLWDFRKTLADLMAENHYDQLGDLLHKRGMGRYTESHENNRAMIADGMEVKRKADVPMSAIWTPGPINQGDQTMHRADIMESASVAHLYGQNLVAAESLTALGVGGAAWSYSPENLKPTADLELASGLNRFVIHTSVHQPTDQKIPGLGLGPFGQWFTRHETWGEQAKAWADYLSRSSYLLQQGKFVADVLYYYGEDSNITALFGKKLPSVPAGYSFDFVNADALINMLSVKGGKIVTPSGMRYQVLVLDENAKNMSLPVLRKIRDLVKAGATLTGVRPEKIVSLSDNQEDFKAIVAEVWGSGNKNVFLNQSIEQALAAKKIQADFTYTKPQSDTEILHVHRTLPDREIYWLNNRKDRVETIETSFRIAGKVPEIWHPENGKIEKVSYQIKDGRTIVPLRLEPHDAIFVVFKGNATVASYTQPKVTEKQLAAITNPWEISFQAGRGAPATATLNALQSWTENADAGIKYFSGTASYQTTFSLPKISKGAKIELDLGTVKDLAEVIVNGKSIGVLWKKPFNIDVSSAVKAGVNNLEIKVTNLWVNRLIGDQQPNVTNKITYTTMPFFQANSPLLPSGLLGPVQVWEKK
ncbi:MAG: glycoside hydrolase [Blastocatellia bacterium]|nr:glycoside hydrolase [Blastocatellia bacterium]